MFGIGEALPALRYRTMPDNIKRGKRLKIMQIELSGIQSFLFGDLTIHSTEEVAAKRSRFIEETTIELSEQLQKAFAERDAYRELTRSSGKLTCAVSHKTPEGTVRDVLDRLQRAVSASCGGRLELYYAVADAHITDRESGADVTALLSERLNKNKFHCTNLLRLDQERDYLEALAHTPNMQEERVDQKERSREKQVAIKLDLDNLGTFFHQIQMFDERNRASIALNKTLKAAFSGISQVQEIFIGGDDIFVVTPLDGYLGVMYRMHENIRDHIISDEALIPYREHFGLSGGTSVIRADLAEEVPMLHYYEQSEEALEQAKQVDGKNVVSLCGTILPWKTLGMLSRVLDQYNEIIFSGTGRADYLTISESIPLLITQVLKRNKRAKNRFLTHEEETAFQKTVNAYD